jgi:hypothetical protein
MASLMTCPNCLRPVEVAGGAENPWVECPHCHVTVPNTSGPRLPAVLRWPGSDWFGLALVLVPIIAWSLALVGCGGGRATPMLLVLLFGGSLVLLRLGHITLPQLLPRPWAVTVTVALGAVLLLAWGIVLLAMVSNS